MVITKKRIRNLDRYFGFIRPGSQIVLGVRLGTTDPIRLQQIGFGASIEVGDTVLPSAEIGPVSRFNSRGRERVHKDLPMETAYRQAEWRWIEWHGPYEHERIRIVDVPYQRYPRTLVPPPSVELTVSRAPSGEITIITPEFTYTDDQKQLILHAVNLVLEIFGECEIFTSDLQALIKSDIRRLNWRILPPGRQPWEQIKSAVESVVRKAPKGNWPVIEYRIAEIHKYGPTFCAIGNGGFHGYVVFGFPERNLYVLESTQFDNATYVFAEHWEELSKRTKAEILTAGLHKDRIIHRGNWASRIRQLLERPTA